MQTQFHDEVMDFITSCPAPEAVIAFHPSPGAVQRFEELVFQSKSSGLAPNDRTELDGYFHLEHLMRLAKAKARLRLTPE